MEVMSDYTTEHTENVSLWRFAGKRVKETHTVTGSLM